MIAAYESVAKAVYKSRALSIIPFIRSIFFNLHRKVKGRTTNICDGFYGNILCARFYTLWFPLVEQSYTKFWHHEIARI